MLTVFNLNIFHYHDAKSDKVWGNYQVNENGAISCYRFWGRTFANKYSEAQFTQSEMIRVQAKKIKEGYNEVFHGTDLYKDIEAKLPALNRLVIKSQVTEEEVKESDAIKPSQVYRTVEVNNTVEFHSKTQLLGFRSMSHKDKIFAHLRRTKEVSDVLDKDGVRTLKWRDK